VRLWRPVHGQQREVADVLQRDVDVLAHLCGTTAVQREKVPSISLLFHQDSAQAWSMFCATRSSRNGCRALLQQQASWARVQAARASWLAHPAPSRTLPGKQPLLASLTSLIYGQSIHTHYIQRSQAQYTPLGWWQSRL
jgi:hypothetical protein